MNRGRNTSSSSDRNTRIRQSKHSPAPKKKDYGARTNGQKPLIKHLAQSTCSLLPRLYRLYEMRWKQSLDEPPPLPNNPFQRETVLYPAVTVPAIDRPGRLKEGPVKQSELLELLTNERSIAFLAMPTYQLCTTYGISGNRHAQRSLPSWHRSWLQSSTLVHATSELDKLHNTTNMLQILTATKTPLPLEALIPFHLCLGKLSSQR